MKVSFALCVAVVTAALSGGLVTASDSAQEPRSRSIADRVYSDDQAERGRTLFRDVCIVCHPDPLWRTGWEGRTVGELYTKILKGMPDDDPGSLSPAEAASAVAYILQSNGFAAGMVPLPADLDLLTRIRVDAPPK